MFDRRHAPTAFDPHRIRSQIRCLASRKPPVYLDNACMTLKPDRVRTAADSYYDHPGCHGRSTHRFARVTSEALETARRGFAALLGAEDPRGVVFTRNTTDSINMVAGMLGLRSGDAVLTTELEHNSNMLPWQFLKYRQGVGFLRVPIAPDQETFDLGTYEEALRSSAVRLVSVFHVSNVTGMRLPIPEMAAIARRHGARFLLDAAQSAWQGAVEADAWGLDFVALSAHKLFGPTGVGVLFGRPELLDTLTPVEVGGECVLDAHPDSCTFAPLPRKFESGLLNYSGITGAGEALAFLRELDIPGAVEHVARLNRQITEGIIGLPGTRILGPSEPGARNGITNFTVTGRDVSDIGLLLEKGAAIMTRTGFHCAHAWYHTHGLTASLRASFSIHNTDEEARLLVDTLRAILRR